MENLDDQKIDKRSKAYKDSLKSTTVETPTELPVVDQKNTQSSENFDILNHLRKLEAEIASLKAPKSNPFEEAKKRYGGPWKYSYSLWDGVPVISRETFRKDINKDLVFKTQFGQYESNHYLHVKLIDGTVRDVEVNDFTQNRVLSEKLFADVSADNKQYTFTDPVYGAFVVLLPFIN